MKEEGREAFSIIPEEMWRYIFCCLYSKLDGHRNPENKPVADITTSDLLVCSRVCKDFEAILKPTKTAWLFKEIFPIIFSHLPINDVLKCREVCNEWSRIIDKFLWDMTYACPVDEEPEIRRRWTGCGKMVHYMEYECYFFKTTQQIREFDRWFGESHSNTCRSPFIHKTMYVEGRIFPSSEVIEGLALVRNIVSKFGSHLAHFSFGVISNILIYAQGLREFLDALPNLEYLEVFGTVEMLQPENPTREELLRRDLFVKLPRLKMLHFNVLEDLSFVIQTKLVTLHANQLTRLFIVITEDLQSIRVPVEMPHLKELNISVESFKNAEMFVSQLRHSLSPPQLKLFGVTVSAVDLNYAEGTIDKVIRLVNQFGATLHAIRLESDGNFDDFRHPSLPVIQEKLVCSKVKVVKLLGCSQISFNLLLDCVATLEDLHVEMTEEDNPRDARASGEVIDFHRYLETGRMCESNIWSVLPHLQFLKWEYKNPVKGCGSEGSFDRKTYKRV